MKRRWYVCAKCFNPKVYHRIDLKITESEPWPEQVKCAKCGSEALKDSGKNLRAIYRREESL